MICICKNCNYIWICAEITRCVNCDSGDISLHPDFSPMNKELLEKMELIKNEG